jgi:hypothetical protein
VNTIVSKADLDDRRWLDERLAGVRDGVEDARDIFLNWIENRNVSRFAEGQTYGDFIASQLGGVRLDLPRLIAALPDMSNRELAKGAGVDEGTIRNRKKEGAEYSAPEPAEPARVIGADGKSYPGRVVREVTAEVIEPEEAMPRRPKREAPPWRRHFTLWCRRVLPEDRPYLIQMSKELHQALAQLGATCEGGNP